MDGTGMTYEDIMEDAWKLFEQPGGMGNKDARIVDRMRRVISAYAFTSNLSFEYIIRHAEDMP